MRRTAFLGFVLLLSGCEGFGGFMNNTFSLHGDPNRPYETAQNVQRANGAQPTVVPIEAQTGNVWPGPIKPLPSLADIAKTLPEAQGVPVLPPVPANPAMPPRSAMPVQPAQPSTIPAVPPPAPSPSSQYNPSVPKGTTIHTSKGPEIVSGGTGNFLTLTSPSGQYGGIMVPNGNGTSTIIRPDGSVETVTTPRP